MSILDPRAALTSSDTIDGDGDDQFAGTYYSDVLKSGKGNDKLFGAGGGDRLYGGEGADTLDGGDGHDTVTYEFSTSPEGIRLNLNDTNDSEGEAKGDEFVGIEAFVGSTQDDVIIGHDTRYNELFGHAGDDTIEAGAAGDRLFGQAGADRLYSGAGADTLTGGSDDDPAYDTVSYQNAAGAITLNLTTGVHTGEARGDIFRAIDSFAGSTFGDEMIGSDRRDDLYGDRGNDSLEGGAGNDFLIGEAGDDILFAGDGNDKLYGGRQGLPRTEGWD